MPAIKLLISFYYFRLFHRRQRENVARAAHVIDDTYMSRRAVYFCSNIDMLAISAAISLNIYASPAIIRRFIMSTQHGALNNILEIFCLIFSRYYGAIYMPKRRWPLELL